MGVCEWMSGHQEVRVNDTPLCTPVSLRSPPPSCDAKGLSGHKFTLRNGIHLLLYCLHN